MFQFHIWRYHIFPFLDKESTCRILSTCSNFYNCPKKKKLWECIAKQHWKHCILPKNYLKVVKYFHSLENLSMYESRMHRNDANPMCNFTEIYSMCFEDIYDVFYNQELNVIIYITKYRIYIKNLNPSSYNPGYDGFILNIIDYSYSNKT